MAPLRLALALLLASSLTLASANSLQNAGATLEIHTDKITLLRGDKPALELDAIRFNYHAPVSQTLLAADDDRILLELEYPAVVDFYRAPSDTSTRKATVEITKVEGGFRLHSAPSWARQTTLELAYLGDHFFGLSEPLQPNNQKSPDLTGASIKVEVASEGESLLENYASAFSAFYVSSFGYGSFFDTFARGRYDFAINGTNRIHHDTGILDWYLFSGDDGAAIHQSYYSLIGAPKPLPAWGVGPVAWRDQNDGGAAEILDDIERMTDLRIPLTSWFVDRPYSDGNHAWSEMNFNEKFANPESWISAIREKYGLEFMTWTSTAMFGSERFPKHLDGKFTYLDLSHPETVAQFQNELAKKQYAHGVKGHKMDRADELFPLYEDWHDNSVGPAQRRNRYTYLFAKIHDQALREAWGDDQVTFARAAIHRVQPYLSALWGGDPRSNWEGLQSNIANGIRCSLMGFPVWGTDVGGYLGEGKIDEDLYIRWLQAGSVNGLFEIKLDGAGGSGEDRMPWHYGKRLQTVFRAVCEDRMRLLPYLYSLSHTAAKTGALMQPMAYRHLDDPETYGIWDQFYVGPNILAAPVLTPGESRRVYFPAGDWFDYDDLSKRFTVETGQWREIDAPLEKLPRWIRSNSIVVTGNVYQGNSRVWDDSAPQLTIKAFPGKIGESCSFDYVDRLDSNKVKKIELSRDTNGIHVKAPEISCTVTVEIYDSTTGTKPESFSVNGPIEITWGGE